MELVEETVKLPKEMKLVKDALIDVIAGLVAKKPLAELALMELPKFEAAVQGYAALPEEVKCSQAYVAEGLFIGQVIQALKGGVQGS